MRIRVSGKKLSQLKADAAVCFAYEGDSSPHIEAGPLRRELAAQMKADRFNGGINKHLVWNTGTRFGSRRIIVAGLGVKQGAEPQALRLAIAGAVRTATGLGATTLALQLPPVESAGEAARAATEGAIMGDYQFDRYLTDAARKTSRLRSVEFSISGRGVKRGVEKGEVVGNAICLARDLVNEGPSRLTPRAFARMASAEARKSGLSCRVLGKPDIDRLKLQALAAVSRGSAEPPRVVHLTYKPPGPRSSKKVLLVGKGVTFDSGGLDLKPAEAMLTMKMDMAGAGAVLATMTGLRSLGCRVEVHALLGLVENMTGGAAYKPGDILDTHRGLTVEVGNTDAEGRLVMCDLLSYGSQRLRPTHVVDVATLTGACVVALGLRATGLFTRHESMRDALMEASDTAGEKFWPLPMYEEYLQLLQKGPADLCNIGGRWGGAITAALFLGEFVPRELPWAHLDIAGPAFTESELPEAPLGGTGAAVPSLLRWLESV